MYRFFKISCEIARTFKLLNAQKMGPADRACGLSKYPPVDASSVPTSVAFDSRQNGFAA